MTKKKDNIVDATDSKTESDARTAFRRLIALYKEQNPIKYEQKREALEKKLSTL